MTLVGVLVLVTVLLGGDYVALLLLVVLGVAVPVAVLFFLGLTRSRVAHAVGVFEHDVVVAEAEAGRIWRWTEI